MSYKKKQAIKNSKPSICKLRIPTHQNIFGLNKWYHEICERENNFYRNNVIKFHFVVRRLYRVLLFQLSTEIFLKCLIIFNTNKGKLSFPLNLADKRKNYNLFFKIGICYFFFLFLLIWEKNSEIDTPPPLFFIIRHRKDLSV